MPARLPAPIALSRRKGRLVFWFWLITLSFASLAAKSSSSDTAAPAVRRPLVLTLHSYGPGPWVNNLQNGLVRGLSGGSSSVDFYVDYMDARRIDAPDYFKQLSQLFRLKYRGQRFDLVVACDDPAYRFALENHRELWGATPVVFCGLDELPKSEVSQREGFTGLAENNDLAPFVRALPRLRPKLRRLLVIADDSTFGNNLFVQLTAALAPLSPALAVERIATGSLGDLHRRLAGLPEDSAVFYISLWRDLDGRFLSGADVQGLLERSSAPVFGVRESFVGHGIVGASFVDGGEHGEAVGLIARQLLAGVTPAQLPARIGPPRRIVFDAPSLTRFRIPPKALPPGAEIINAPFSFYRAYRTQVWFALGIIATLVAIVIALVANIVLRQRAVLRLQESESRFHAIFDQTYQLAGLLDIEGRLLAVNRTALRFVGISEEQACGRFLWETAWWSHDAGEQEKTRQAVLRAAQGEVVRFESHHINATGEVRLVDFSIKPIFGADGRVRHLLPEGRDVTDIKRAEEHLRSVLDSAPLVLWTTDAAGRFTMSTGSGLRLLGLKPNEVVGLYLSEVYRHDPGVVAAARRALVGESVRTTLAVGDQFFDTHIEPRVGPTGTIIGTTGVAFDISERIRAQTTQLQLATAVEQAAEAIVLTDPTGLIQYVNPAFEKITGYTRQEAIGQTPRLLKSGRHDDTHYRRLWQTLSSGRAWSGRLENRRKDGALILEDTTITPLMSDDRVVQGYVAVQRDVTEQVRLEDSFRHTQRVEAIGKLAGGVAHDFNNILQIIKANVTFARELGRHRSELDEYLEQIDQAATRAAGLTRQLLAFGRKQSLQFKIIQPADAIGEVLRLIGRLIGAHIEVDFKAEPGLASIRADIGQLEQVVLNLCVNARDAMPQGGRLSVHLRNVALAAEDLPPEHTLPPGRYVELAVADTGTGMDAETVARIFEPFFTTKSVGHGTGLGLSVVQGIVQQHGGFIRVTSAPGRGSNFHIFLPASSGEAAVATLPTVAAPRPHGASQLLLLAEDDPAVRIAATKILQHHGYQLLVATDGEEACTLGTPRLAEISAAVFDVVMPRLSGIEAAKRLRQLRPNLPVILCSGYASGLPEGGLPDSRLVQKPYTPEELLGALEAALKQTT